MHRPRLTAGSWQHTAQNLTRLGLGLGLRLTGLSSAASVLCMFSRNAGYLGGILAHLPSECSID
jgi:hypothetical protein